MAKTASDLVLDNGPQYIKDNAILMTVCNAQPTTYAEATSTFKLADVVMASADFTLSNGDTSGRKVAVAAKSAVPIDTTGTAVFVALVDAAALLIVTTCTSQALTSGGTVDIPTWDDEIADPT